MVIRRQEATVGLNPHRDRARLRGEKSELKETVAQKDREIESLRDQVASRNERLRPKIADEDARVAKRDL